MERTHRAGKLIKPIYRAGNETGEYNGLPVFSLIAPVRAAWRGSGSVLAAGLSAQYQRTCVSSEARPRSDETLPANSNQIIARLPPIFYCHNL